MGSYLKHEQNVLFLMFLKRNNLIFLFILIARTIITISSRRWINAWLALEINMTSIIPILIGSQTYKSTSSCIKYFITQAMASILLIIIIVVIYNAYTINYININNEVIFIALAIKSGIPPFHFWLPQVIEIINVTQIFITISWQKIAPFTLISYSLSEWMILIVIVSVVVGAVGGYNKNSIKKIIAYSSITHGAWIVTSIIIKAGIWINYFIVYNVRLLIICIIMLKIRVNNISEVNNSYLRTETKVIFIVNLLSISGLPPFLGFAAKFLVLKLGIFTNIALIILLMLIISFLSVFYYLKVCFSSFLVSEKQTFRWKGKSTTSLIVAFLVANTIIPVMVYYA